jgi:uncharacterized membrane protein
MGIWSALLLVAAIALLVLVQILHLGPIFSSAWSAARSLSISVQQLVPLEALLRMIILLYCAGIVLFIIGLHRKAEKYVMKLYNPLAVAISIVWGIFIASPVAPPRNPTVIELIVLWASFLVAGYTFVVLPFLYLYKLWRLMDKHALTKKIKGNEVLWHSLATVAVGWLLYKWYDWFKQGALTSDDAMIAVITLPLFLYVAGMFLVMLFGVLGQLIGVLRILINKI